MLVEFGPSLFVAEGPTVSFFGFPYPTRMAVARLSNGSAWIWSPIALTPDLERGLHSIGPVREIVSPNKLHHLFLAEWAARWPNARLRTPPGLAKRRRDLHFHTELGDLPDPAWAAEIDQVAFHGSFALTDLCVLVQRLDSKQARGWKGMVMRLDGLVGERGSAPRELRASFLRRGPARAARARVLAWQPEQLLIAHGACSHNNATQILTRALGWI